MSFIALEPSPEATPGASLPNATFWPVIELDTLRRATRLDGTVTAERLTHAAINAIAEVNADLSDWRSERQADGYTSLAEVPAEEINGQSLYLHHYRRAVYALTQAGLTERYRGFDATAKGEQQAEAREPEIDDLYRDARWAVRNILGIPHSTVELI